MGSQAGKQAEQGTASAKPGYESEQSDQNVRSAQQSDSEGQFKPGNGQAVAAYLTEKDLQNASTGPPGSSVTSLSGSRISEREWIPLPNFGQEALDAVNQDLYLSHVTGRLTMDEPQLPPKPREAFLLDPFFYTRYDNYCPGDPFDEWRPPMFPKAEYQSSPSGMPSSMQTEHRLVESPRQPNVASGPLVGTVAPTPVVSGVYPPVDSALVMTSAVEAASKQGKNVPLAWEDKMQKEKIEHLLAGPPLRKRAHVEQLPAMLPVHASEEKMPMLPNARKPISSQRPVVTGEYVYPPVRSGAPTPHRTASSMVLPPASEPVLVGEIVHRPVLSAAPPSMAALYSTPVLPPAISAGGYFQSSPYLSRPPSAVL